MLVMFVRILLLLYLCLIQDLENLSSHFFGVVVCHTSFTIYELIKKNKRLMLSEVNGNAFVESALIVEAVSEIRMHNPTDTQTKILKMTVSGSIPFIKPIIVFLHCPYLHSRT